MTQPAALYARVSSDRQKENHTIDSQTAALIQFAQTHGYQVPPQWQFQDEGYSGATLARPALEALRDLVHQGSIRAVLVYSPDRLSRSYAYQVILAEEFTRAGVELVFLQAPPADTPEQRLLLQFQGMMAEYERAQIAERCRRGKRHRAQQGSVSVLCRAPYGYRYLPKNETSAAAYQVVESEAQVVRWIFAAYTQEGLSMTALARWLNQHQVPTRTGAPWISSTLWGMLRNPAYQGKACFGKTKAGPPQPRATRRVRLRGPAARRYPSSPQRPRAEWIEIPVPPLVSPQTFALAQEQMEKNRRYSSRRTTVATLLQSLLVCQHCGYALYRAWSQNTQGRKTYYYRCPGTDASRRAQGTVCHNRPLRQDALDQRVWEEVVRLLQDPTLIQTEIQRRQQEASKADPHLQREELVSGQQARLHNQITRLFDAYQEGLIPWEEFRPRMVELRRQQQVLQAELESLHMAAQHQSRYLRLVETLSEFRTRLCNQAETLNVQERQKVVRLLVKEVLVGSDSIVIRHSIPIARSTPGSDSPHPLANPSKASPSENYLLRTCHRDKPRFYCLKCRLHDSLSCSENL